MNAVIVVKRKNKVLYRIPCVLESKPKNGDKDVVRNKVEDKMIEMIDQKYYRA